MKNRNVSSARSTLRTAKAHLFRLVPAMAVTALIALIMQVSAASAQAFSAGDLNGAYADSGSGFSPLTGPPGAFSPVSGVGLWTFNGAGTFTASLVLSGSGGTIRPNISGTYSVSADGTGAIDWVSSGIQRSRSFVIGDRGMQLRYVHTDNAFGQVFGGTMVKQ